MFKQARKRLSLTHKEPSIESVDPPNRFSDFYAMEADQANGRMTSQE